MISKQSVYLNSDRSQAVPEGHKDARFLLVREGHEVDEKLVDKYDGASALVGSASKSKAKDEPLPPGPTLKGDSEPAKPARKKKSAK